MDKKSWIENIYFYKNSSRGFKGSLISIKMDQKAWLPKNATQKLPQIFLRESIEVGILIIGYYIIYIVSGQNQHTYSYTFFQDNLRQFLRCIFGQSSFSIHFDRD